MAYTQDVRVAARRHFRAAQVLYGQAGPGDQLGCKAVAGYLFGIAGAILAIPVATALSVILMEIWKFQKKA